MQFCVYRISGDRLVLDLQSGIPSLPTRVIAPLIPERPDLKAISVLEPVFVIEGRRYVLHTGELVSAPASVLAPTPVADLREYEYEIRRALDMLFSGF
jgi:toxin CcdB